MEPQPLGGRGYIPRQYRLSGRRDIHAFLHRAIEASGAEVLYSSSPTRAPYVFGVQPYRDQPGCLVVYAFRCNPAPIRGRPPDEHRVQIRYGSESTWGEEHPLAEDPTGSDVTLVLGVHLEAELFLGLAPLLYSDLPMGISVEFKEESVREAGCAGWFVWERDNISGLRRPDPRSRGGLETLVAFTPDRLLQYAEFERRATALRLDPPLRFRAAEAAAASDGIEGQLTSHRLEHEFNISAAEILDIVMDRSRLGVALRGGVAEHHLQKHLTALPGVREVRALDEDGQHDFDVTLAGRKKPVRVECKNCSPKRYANGDYKVETQKTRASQSDPSSRYYRRDQFDVVAACLYPPTSKWQFRFKQTTGMEQHPDYPGRLAPMQHVDEGWTTDFMSVV